jgi:hypothetical protein
MVSFGRSDRETFDENLSCLKKVEYKTGTARGEGECRIYTLLEDKVKKEYINFFRMPDDLSFVMYPYTKDEFLRGLREFQIGRWKREYFRKRVLDGWYWDLCFYCRNDLPTSQYQDRNAVPRNDRVFEAFMKAGEEKQEVK